MGTEVLERGGEVVMAVEVVHGMVVEVQDARW